MHGGSASGGATALHGKLKSWNTTKGDTMSIKREDLDAGRVSFADVTSGRRLAPVHPGAGKIDTFERGGSKECFQSLYGPAAKMFTQQGVR